MPPRFIQIHTLTSYPASLLNRDDAGFAKRIPFGGSVRTRISSQCLKRHWRVYDGDHSLREIDAPESVRSRVSFEKYVVEPLVAEGTPLEVARAAASKLIGKIFGGEAKQEKAEKLAKKARGKGKEAEPAAEATPASPPAKTEQVTVLGRPELDYICGLARDACKQAGGAPEKAVAFLEERTKNDKELKKNIGALNPGSLEAGLGAALFGRMVTGDILARADGAVHVAHSMTVHGQLTESDYFSAIDDLVREEGEQGSGHINASELTSGLFYGYVVVDVRGLLGNLGDDRTLATDVLGRLVHMVATVSPGAKKGSTAPYAYSHLVCIESGTAQPRTLANAFLEAVTTRGNVVENAYVAMAGFLEGLDVMYGRPAEERRVHAGLGAAALLGERAKALGEDLRTLAELSRWTRDQL